MVLTQSELIASLQHEVHVLLHLSGKIEPRMIASQSAAPRAAEWRAMFRRRVLRWVAGALILATLAAWLVITFSPDDPARWHLDPATIALRGTPNEYLAAPPGTTAASPSLAAAIHPSEPTALLACFDGIARAHPRVQVLAVQTQRLHRLRVAAGERGGLAQVARRLRGARGGARLQAALLQHAVQQRRGEHDGQGGDAADEERPAACGHGVSV